MSISEQIVELAHTNRLLAAHIAELLGWLQDGVTQGADNAVVAGLLQALSARLAQNQRTIRDLLWRDRLEKARMS